MMLVLICCIAADGGKKLLDADFVFRVSLSDGYHQFVHIWFHDFERDVVDGGESFDIVLGGDWFRFDCAFVFWHG